MSSVYLNDKSEWEHACALIKPIATYNWTPSRGYQVNVQYSDFDVVRVMRAMPFLTELCISTNDPAFYYMMLAPEPIS